MCIFPKPPTPSTPPPPPVPPVDPIKPPPPTEVIKDKPISIVPAPTKRNRGLGIGQAESPASGGVPLGIGSNPGNKTINTGV